jgi:hypothetical protein
VPWRYSSSAPSTSDSYYAVYFDIIPTIGPLFLLDFIAATVIGLMLLIPSARTRGLHILLALGGIGLSATSLAGSRARASEDKGPLVGGR